MKISFKQFLCLFLLLCQACADPTTNRLNESQRVKDEIEARKVKRITPAQILETATAWGKSNTSALQTNLTQVMSAGIAKGALLPTARLCNATYLPVTDSLKKTYGTQVRRLSFSGKPDKPLTDAETQLMDAYNYNLEKKLPLNENIQKIGDSLLVFTTPVLISDEVCLRCHGKVGKDLAEADFKNLSEEFPKLKTLTNFEKNKPIGIWSLIFRKSEVVRNTK